MRKAPVKRVKLQEFFCPHCGMSANFPITYCKICKDHSHVLFMGLRDEPSHPGICTQCWQGRSSAGRKWRREQGTWAPNPFIPASYDDPEWFDLNEEYKNMTLEDVWHVDYYTIEEF